MKDKCIENFHIRKAQEEDAGLVVGFMRKLGTYQKMRDSITITEESARRLLREKAGEAIFGEMDGKIVAFLYYYNNSSAFIGEKGMYIDGFYVDEAYRGYGLGKQMMEYMANLALERGCGKLEWGCLDWNQPALDFYKNLGAKGVDTMTIYRLSKDKIELLAGRDK